MYRLFVRVIYVCVCVDVHVWMHVKYHCSVMIAKERAWVCCMCGICVASVCVLCVLCVKNVICVCMSYKVHIL